MFFRTGLAALLLICAASSGVAHTKADTTTPTDAATVATVEVIAVRFEDPIRVTALTVVGPDGVVPVTRETGMDPVTEFRAVPPADMPDGPYSVEWRGLAEDGHPMQGTFSFTVAR